MEELIITETNSADDSKGELFGLEGNLAFAVVGSLIGSILLFTLLFMIFQAGLVFAATVSAIPTVCILGWIIALKNGKDPGYDKDWFDLILKGPDATYSSKGQPKSSFLLSP